VDGRMDGWIFILLCLLRIFDMYAVFCGLFANWHSPATVTEVYPCFFTVVRQMSGYTSQRRGTVRTVPN
jgi:hypothetical protein